jgi:hypothetical protein
MTQKRDLFRVNVHRVGRLHRGTETVACEITELTPYGIGLKTSLPMARGETVELEFELAKHCPICCLIVMTHITPPTMGGRITAISLEHQKRITRFIEQHAALNLTAV